MAEDYINMTDETWQSLNLIFSDIDERIPYVLVMKDCSCPFIVTNGSEYEVGKLVYRFIADTLSDINDPSIKSDIATWWRQAINDGLKEDRIERLRKLKRETFDI